MVTIQQQPLRNRVVTQMVVTGSDPRKAVGGVSGRSSAHRDPFAALGDGTRRAILEHLAVAPLAVHELADRLPVSRPAVSRHLRLLHEAGLVSVERDGLRRVYRLSHEGLETADEYLQRVWGERATRFRLYVENTRPPT